MNRRVFARVLALLPLGGLSVDRLLPDGAGRRHRDAAVSGLVADLRRRVRFAVVETHLRALDERGVSPTEALPLLEQEHLFNAIIAEITAQPNWLERVETDLRLKWLATHRDALRDCLFLNSPRDAERDEHYYWQKFGGCSH